MHVPLRWTVTKTDKTLTIVYVYSKNSSTFTMHFVWLKQVIFLYQNNKVFSDDHYTDILTTCVLKQIIYYKTPSKCARHYLTIFCRKRAISRGRYIVTHHPLTSAADVVIPNDPLKTDNDLVLYIYVPPFLRYRIVESSCFTVY